MPPVPKEFSISSRLALINPVPRTIRDKSFSNGSNSVCAITVIGLVARYHGSGSSEILMITLD